MVLAALFFGVFFRVALLPRARPQVGFLYPVPPGDTDVCQDSRADDDRA